MTPREVLAFCREKDVKAVDLRFVDLLGKWHQITIPVNKLDPHLFDDGIGFDGSALPGWQPIHESDLLLVPQSETAFLDPFAAIPSLSLICNVVDPATGDAYGRDPRHIALKASNYLKSTGIADAACLAPKAEFFIFDAAKFDQSAYVGQYQLATDAGDSLAELRGELLQGMLDCSLDVQAQNYGPAHGRQCQLDLSFQPLVTMADWMMIYKFAAKSVAQRRQKVATFMPKPVFGNPGSGMLTHLSLWKEGEPLFAGSGYAGLSDIGLYALGGILRHAPALLALTCPTMNSYKRLVPGQQAPVYLTYSQRNRSAACRIPMESQNPRSRRIEFRCPDPSCNPYLAFAAIVMAAIDGIQLKLHPGQPIDKNLFEMSPAELADVPRTPATLDESLRALEADSEFLLRDDVFTSDVLENWIDLKRKNEIEALRLRPHPYEFCLYFNA